ncbi:MAG: hypothetical protein HUJ94_06765, partial [Bacteroidales bacterium]|nr:hypothetical protein [Bacteroidales bacterium]
MKKNYILLLSMLALTVWGCQDDITGDNTAGTSASKEVQFGSSLISDLPTKTIYGDENTAQSYFPILWLEGDQVLV